MLPKRSLNLYQCLVSSQPPGGIPGSQPLLPNSLDPTRPQGKTWAPLGSRNSQMEFLVMKHVAVINDYFLLLMNLSTNFPTKSLFLIYKLSGYQQVIFNREVQTII